MSRGNVTITSGNTDDLPIINPNWMTHPTDASVAVATFKRLRAAFDTAAMNPVLLGGREYYPGDRVQGDGEILDFVRDNLHTVWHASCTCKMGRNDDPLAVVDADAKVFGVKGLRVVDASAFALLPPGHPVSMVYALAEKIAERILEE